MVCLAEQRLQGEGVMPHENGRVGMKEQRQIAPCLGVDRRDCHQLTERSHATMEKDVGMNILDLLVGEKGYLTQLGSVEI